jgi:hypothetical protein
MSTCPPNLRQSFLTICKIIKFKVDEKGFFLVTMEDIRVLEAKKISGIYCTTFYSCP